MANESTSSDIKPKIRLIGILLGAAGGGMVIVLPPPVGRFFGWLFMGVFVGAGMAVSLLATAVQHITRKNDLRLFWILVAIAGFLGGVVALTMWWRGNTLPEMAWVASSTGGLFLGYAIAELISRRSVNNEV